MRQAIWRMIIGLKLIFKVDLIKEIEINSNFSNEKKMAATKAITG